MLILKVQTFQQIHLLNILIRWVGNKVIDNTAKKIIESIVDRKINIEASSLINPFTGKDGDKDAPFIFYDAYVYYRHLDNHVELMMRLSSSIPLAISAVDYNNNEDKIRRIRWTLTHDLIYTDGRYEKNISQLSEKFTSRYMDASVPVSTDYNMYLNGLYKVIDDGLLKDTFDLDYKVVGKTVYKYLKEEKEKK